MQASLQSNESSVPSYAQTLMKNQLDLQRQIEAQKTTLSLKKPALVPDQQYKILQIRNLKPKRSDDTQPTPCDFPTLDEFRSIVEKKLPIIQKEINESFPESKVVIRQCRRFSKHSGDITISPASVVPLIESKFNEWFQNDQLRLRINQESFLINKVPKEADLDAIQDELKAKGHHIRTLRWLSQKKLENPNTTRSSLLLSVDTRLSDPAPLQLLRSSLPVLILNTVFPVRNFLESAPPVDPKRNSMNSTLNEQNEEEPKGLPQRS